MIYTAGELAKKLGVSARTIRFYDEKNLLLPCGYSEAGYRLYNKESAKRLQKILMLRFLDFSIEQISDIMQEEHFDIKKSLKEQEELLLKKKEHIERILAAVRKLSLLEKNTEQSTDSSLGADQNASETEQYFWKYTRQITEIIRKQEYITEQYRTDDNLNHRISIHDYSTSSIGFYPWMSHRISLDSGMKVLDLGCGNAAFWKGIAASLPDHMEIHLVDYSDGMLASAEKNIYQIQTQFPEKHLHFILDKRDASNFSYPVSGFDRIMANHLLFHLNREARLDLYPKINTLLTKNGRFSCSLIGHTHLHELHEFLRTFYPEIIIPSSSFDLWLENAAQELEPYFTILKTEEHANNLLVPKEELIFDYVSSYSAQAKEILQNNRETFFERIRQKMNQDGLFYIHKSTGIVLCSKASQT